MLNPIETLQNEAEQAQTVLPSAEIRELAIIPGTSVKPSHAMMKQCGLLSSLEQLPKDVFNSSESEIVRESKYSEAQFSRVTRGQYSYFIPIEAVSKIRLRVSVYQLLDAIMQRFTQYGFSPTASREYSVTIPIDEYMELRGLKDKKEAKAQLNIDLEVLGTICITEARTNEKGRAVGIERTYLTDHTMVLIDTIEFTFSQSFVLWAQRKLATIPHMQLLFKIDPRRNPNSYFFGKKLEEYKNMNRGKGNENIISVRSLLLSSPNMATEEAVRESGRHYTQQIIDPFERDMDALGNCLSWEYCNKHAVPLTDAEHAAGISWKQFKNLYVLITWKNYPETRSLTAPLQNLPADK